MHCGSYWAGWARQLRCAACGTIVDTIADALLAAVRLVFSLDPALLAIVTLSLKVSLAAVFFAALFGLPLGAVIAVGRFPGRHALVVLLNALMGLPPVVVGLLVYLLLSRSGPLGSLGILFTPTAMVVAQTILILPIIAALCRQAVEDAWREYAEQLHSLGVHGLRAALTLLWDTRFSLLTSVLAGLGRACAEVGAVMIVGGNIDGVTRVMTTTIALETSKGDLALALALGIVLIVIVVALNAAAFLLREAAERRYG
jgi:tungstate transport system permease protein